MLTYWKSAPRAYYKLYNPRPCPVLKVEVGTEKETEMEETKPWYLSRGVWSGVVAALIGVVSMFGLNVEGEQESITNVVLGLAEVVAGIVAIYGRVRAKARIARGSK